MVRGPRPGPVWVSVRGHLDTVRCGGRGGERGGCGRVRSRLGVAPGPTVPAPARAAQLRAVGTAFLRQRPWIVAPSLLAQAALLATSDAPRAQVAAVLTGFTALLSLFAWEARRGRRELVTADALSRSLRITLAGITVGAVATGGIQSPLLPVLFAPTVVGFAAYGRSREGRALRLGLALALLALTLLPRATPFPPLPVATHRAMSLVAALTAVPYTHLTPPTNRRS